MLWSAFMWAILIWIEAKKTPRSWSTAQGQMFWLTCIAYSAGRFVVEQFRDDARGDFILSLSISSWVSLFILFVTGILFTKGTQNAK